MTSEEQLKLWVEGKPVHRNDVTIGDFKLQGGECCPDFSCCMPNLLADEATRKAFSAAAQKEQTRMLTRFLAKMLMNHAGLKVRG